MQATTPKLSIGAGTLFAILALPGAALAQRQLDPVRVTAAAIARADSLYSKAERMEVSSRRDFRRVAQLHEESATLRSVEDAKRAASLQIAAVHRYGGGDRRRAAADMELAAQEAAARGDVVNAANAYIDAAMIAAELRQRDRAVKLVRAAQLLTESPLLSDAQRLQLRTRLPQGSEVAVLERR